MRPQRKMPIVISFDCPEAVQFLNETDPFLTALYGTGPKRVYCDYALSHYVQSIDPVQQQTWQVIANDHPRTPLRRIQQRVTSEPWLINALQRRIVKYCQEELEAKDTQWRQCVKIVLLNKPWAKSIVAKTALETLFSEALFWEAVPMPAGRGLVPIPIWKSTKTSSVSAKRTSGQRHAPRQVR